MIKIAIGPYSWSGGVKTHIFNLHKASKYQTKIIKYSPFSIWYPRYKLSSFLLRQQKCSKFDVYTYILKKYISQNYNILHTHGHPVWRGLYEYFPKTKLKLIHTVHQVYSREDELANEKIWKNMNLKNKLMFDYCRSPDVTTVTVSDFVGEILFDQGISAEVIPNGVDFQEIETANPDRFRTNYNIKEDFFLFIGHMGFIKRPDLFIELANKIPDKKFVMIGPDISEENILIKYNMKIPENLIVLGKTPRATVLDAMKACKVYIQPSVSETFAITLLESTVCRKPTVSTNSGGIPELKKAGVPIILSEANDINDLYEKACYAWDHPELGEQGYQKVKEKYDWNVIIKRIDCLYERVMQ
ncbi:MAG: glycosyltransferase family 4 protein [Candidatus Methanoperedenaceae archaeon]|nr:glycosyltransferase family 4 protein [Candidatus Methanoperedenaceae archaeon]